MRTQSANLSNAAASVQPRVQIGLSQNDLSYQQYQISKQCMMYGETVKYIRSKVEISTDHSRVSQYDNSVLSDMICCAVI